MRSEIYSVMIKPGETVFDVLVRQTGSLANLPMLLRLNSAKSPEQYGPGETILLSRIIELPANTRKPEATQGIQSGSQQVLVVHQKPAKFTANEDKIYNQTEPANSNETPNPENANYYIGDDYEYHFINGRWKRTLISIF